MIVANTKIVVGKRKFQKGQTVTGLSSLDRGWMLAAGYISETPDAPGEQKGRKGQKTGQETLTEESTAG